MKKLIALAASVLLAACGGDSSPDSSPSSPSTARTERAAAADPAASAPAWLDPMARVNPYIGTGVGFPNPQDQPRNTLSGATYPGAALPFGMVQFSPDTGYGQDPANGGYNHAKTTIQGFSLTHASGTGCTVQQDIPILPYAGAITTAPGIDINRYQSTFSHAGEQISPGFYGVTTVDQVRTELTVTRRGGIGRFTFPAGSNPNLIFNLGRGGVPGLNSQLQLIGSDTVEGVVENTGVCGNGRYAIYFHGQFNRPYSSFGTYQGTTVSPGSRSTARTVRAGGWASFSPDEPIELRIAVSYVRVANARLNLQAELQADFDGLRQQAGATWADMLGRVRIEGNGRRDDEVKFTTALYHALLHPTLFSDVNNQYIGFDNAVHTTDGWDKYATFSSWDTSRAQMQLVAWLAPKQGSDMAQSLVVDAQASNAGFPRWPTANSDSCMMYGDPGAVIVANMHAFGATGFDTAAALAVMERGANIVNLRSRDCETRPQLSQYLSQGYISTGMIGNTLEYALADAAIGQFAGALGDTARRDLYLARGQAWKAMQSSTGYSQQRNTTGAFTTPSDPGSYTFGNYTSAQYTFMVPHNLRGVIDRMGGSTAAIAQLDTHFQRLNGGGSGRQAWLAEALEQGTPWAYVSAGAPAKSQALVRRILDEQYANRPEGLMGTDDLGSLSAWYVWGALGLYPEIPGVGGFVVGSPLFPHVEVRMGNGRTLTINAANAGAAGTYIREMQIDGQASPSTWVPLARLANDTVFDVVLGATPPVPPWGSTPEDAPPSFDVPRASTPSTSFSTSFDGLLQQPDWVNTTPVKSGASQLETLTRRAAPLHSGAAALRHAGTVTNSTLAYAYSRLFDVNIPVTASTRLSYWIFPDASLPNSRSVSIDLLFDDGSTLRESAVVDQHGVSLHPRQQGLGGFLQSGAWNNVQADLGTLAGKTVVRIGVGYEQAGATGNFSSTIDDLSISPAPQTASASP